MKIEYKRGKRPTWFWETIEWPNFSYNGTKTSVAENQFFKNTQKLNADLESIDLDERQALVVEMMSLEGIKTSEIEGEYLDRDRLVRSLLQKLGLEENPIRYDDTEAGLANMRIDIYRNFTKPLSKEVLCEWHRFLSGGMPTLSASQVGSYRTSQSPMRVVSQKIDGYVIHFEAPPASKMESEMAAFIDWFNESSDMPAIIKAGIAHLYFVVIHPFADGNGRIARALSEKSLAQSIGRPSVTMLSDAIASDKKTYYDLLEETQLCADINLWLEGFADFILNAQKKARVMIELTLQKTSIYDAHEKLNERQKKAIDRLFAAEANGGFKGGLSSKNYRSITGAAERTTTNDLVDLVDKEILHKTGSNKSTRYYLKP